MACSCSSWLPACSNNALRICAWGSRRTYGARFETLRGTDRRVKTALGFGVSERAPATTPIRGPVGPCVVEADLSGVFSKLQRPGTTAPDPVGGRFQQRSDRGHRHRHSQANQQRINQDDQALSHQRPPQTLASVGSSDLRYVSYACAEAGQQLRALIAVAEHGPCAMPDQAERFSSSSCL